MTSPEAPSPSTAGGALWRPGVPLPGGESAEDAVAPVGRVTVLDGHRVVQALSLDRAGATDGDGDQFAGPGGRIEQLGRAIQAGRPVPPG